jgi:diguanylate cyclase (GGDEF)-like protein/PAS domain S-box-containing protein
MRNRAWFVYLVAAASAIAVYYATGHSSYLFNAIGLSSPLLILVAARLHEPERRGPWYLFALGQFVFIGGDVFSYNYDKIFGTELPYPAISDALYLSVYPCIVAGLFLMIRHRGAGRDRGALIDSAMVAIGVGTLSWVFLISPYVHEDFGLTGLQKLVSMSYPTMDLLLMAVAVRLAVGVGRRAPSFYLMSAAIVTLFVTDSIYAWLLLNSGYTPGSGWLEAGWGAFYVLFGAAALHPSMRTLADRVSEIDVKVSPARLAVLGLASLLAPLTQAIQSWRNQSVDLPVVLGATVTLFVLALVRMAGLVRTQQQSALREKALREAGAELVTATNREGIYAATLDAARALAGAGSTVRVCAALDDSDTFSVVAAVGGRDTRDSSFPISDIAEWKRERLLGRHSYQVLAYESTLREPLGLEQDEGFVHVSPLFIRDALRGLLVVATPVQMPRPIAEGLEALSSQVSLALDSAALTEDLLFQQSEARFASLVKNASDVILVIEPDTTVRYASPSSSRVLDYEPSELEGTKFATLVHPDDKTRVLKFLMAMGEGEGHPGLIEYRVSDRDGTYLHVETLRTNLLHDPNVKGIVLNLRDISERKAFEEQLSHQAFHDAVTNLANRALFRDRVSHALERQQRDTRPIAVLFMDLDDFKTVNDSLGHAAGDVLLREVGERLRECLRAADTAARLGGDEFAILLEDGGDGIQAADVADRIMQVFEAPFHLEGKEVFVRSSIGIAVADGENPVGEVGVEDLLRNADVAMYMAKENGKGRYQMFEPAMHDTALKRLELKADLQRALEHGEFQLHYQPVIELETGAVSGVEALIRWFHPERGIVPPLDFIPLAEETGLIVAIGRWVLREASAYAVALQDRFPHDPPYHMAVNLSARQLQRPEIVDEVREVLEETGLEARSLILEITESVMMADIDMSIERLGELKRIGVQLAVDDFGTGYSSLNYIRRFPVDILKVDKSFVDGVSEEGEASALTAKVIELAGILNLKPVAEGIERADQLQRLLELHCDLGQGYYFAKPLPSPDLESLLAERRSLEAEVEALADS